MSDGSPEFIPYGEAAWLVKYQLDAYSEDVMRHIHAVTKLLREDDDWIEIVPGYDSVLVTFDPLVLDLEEAGSRLLSRLKSAKPETGAGRLIEIPVCYGEHFGPDIGQIAQVSGLTADEIISLHSSQDYLVCMMGFVPGFVFLSPAETKIRHPRHPTPRVKVPAGSVGIAGWQTGIYGIESPGGWQIIGRTPLSVFDRLRENPFLLSEGDKVRFVPISGGDFDD